MSTIPITSGRSFEIVTEDEMWAIRAAKSERLGHPRVKEAVRFLFGKRDGDAVKVKVHDPKRLRQMRLSARGFANRRGYNVTTFHKAGWLYIQRADD